MWVNQKYYNVIESTQSLIRDFEIFDLTFLIFNFSVWTQP